MNWLALHEYTLIGLIWMLVLGPAVGNYACSVVYRLPRGQTPFERHPYCGHCNADLKPVDLFPILSWLSTRGRCRYCAGTIPGIYTLIELACGAVFVAYFLHFGISELFLLYTAYAVFAIILAAIHWQQGWISASIYSYAFIAVALARTLSEHTIYGVIQTSLAMLAIMLVLWRFGNACSSTRRGEVRRGAEFGTAEDTNAPTPTLPLRGRESPFEKPWIWWFVLLGALVPFAEWHYLLPIYLLKLCVPKPARVMVYVAGALVLPLVL